MRLRGRLNQIERKIEAIKEERESTVPVAAGVWFADEQGDIIPDSGPVTRVPREQSKAFGVLLVPAPISKEDWPKEAERCTKYQQKLEQELS